MEGNVSSKIRQGLAKAVLVAIRREHLFMILMGGVVGSAVGFGAIVFRGMIGGISRMGWGTLTGLTSGDVLVMAMAAPFWVRILIPFAGGLVAGIIIWCWMYRAVISPDLQRRIRNGHASIKR